MRNDLNLDEQREWEKQEMEKPVDFTDLHIDPAPFQLVEKSNLLKVHSLFSMLGVNHAYVTTIGRLIGVVGLKELRKAIEDANSGQSPGQVKVNEVNDEESASGASAEDCTETVTENNNEDVSEGSSKRNSLESDDNQEGVEDR